jgi:hypothetical protein
MEFADDIDSHTRDGLYAICVGYIVDDAIILANDTYHMKLYLASGGTDPITKPYFINNACNAGNLEMAKLLIKYKVDISAGNYYGLLLASAKGHIDIVKLLLDHGADPVKYGNSLLIQAIRGNHREIAKLLFDHWLAGSNAK